jgi:hypothetical protein
VTNIIPCGKVQVRNAPQFPSFGSIPPFSNPCNGCAEDIVV